MTNTRLKAGSEVNATEVRGYLIADLTQDLTDKKIKGTVVGGQTGFELNRSRETKEIAHKDCPGGYAKTSASRNTWDFSMDGMYIVDDKGYDLIEEAMASKDGRIGVYVEVGSRRYIGFAILTSNNLSFPYDDSMTYSISGQGDGVLHKVDISQDIDFELPSDSEEEEDDDQELEEDQEDQELEGQPGVLPL